MHAAHRRRQQEALLSRRRSSRICRRQHGFHQEDGTKVLPGPLPSRARQQNVGEAAVAGLAALSRRPVGLPAPIIRVHSGHSRAPQLVHRVLELDRRQIQRRYPRRSRWWTFASSFALRATRGRHVLPWGLPRAPPRASSFDAEIASCEDQLESLRSPAAKLKSARKRLEAAKKQQKVVANGLQQRDIVAKAADRVKQLEVSELRLAGELADAAAHLQTCESAAAAGTAIPIAGVGSAAAGPPDLSAVLQQVAASLTAGDEQAMRWFDKIVIAVRAALPVQPPGADASKKEEN